MPTLKYLFVNATTTELRLLRGKTIECISLIGKSFWFYFCELNFLNEWIYFKGLAVGKEKVKKSKINI